MSTDFKNKWIGILKLATNSTVSRETPSCVILAYLFSYSINFGNISIGITVPIGLVQVADQQTAMSSVKDDDKCPY